MIADARATVDAVFDRLWRPRPFRTLTQWADAHRVVRHKTARPGPWRTDLVPYAAGIMDAISSGRYDQVTLMKASQIAWTEILINTMAYAVCERPGPMMVVYPTRDRGKEVNEDRVLPALMDTPAVVERLTGRARDTQAMLLRFDGMTITYRGAGGTGEHNLEGDPCASVLVDELDRCTEQRPSTMALVRKRVETFPGACLVVGGTPGDEGQGVDAEYHAGDRRVFAVPCPHCGAYHVRRDVADRVTWDHDPALPSRYDADFQTVIDTAAFTCADCGTAIEAKWNLWQQRRGVWIRDGERVETDRRLRAGTPEGESTEADRLFRADFFALRDPAAESLRERCWAGLGVRVSGAWDRPAARHASFWVGGLYRTMDRHGNPYAAAVESLCRSGGRATRNWVNQDCGEGWRTAGAGLDEHALRELCLPVRDGGYTAVPFTDLLTRPAAEVEIPVPEDVYGLACGIDLQRDRAVVVIRGWGIEDRAQRLLAAGEIGVRDRGDIYEGREARELDELDRLLRWRWVRPSGVAVPLAIGIDAAAWTVDVFAWVRRAIAGGYPYIWPVRGASGRLATLVRETAYEHSRAHRQVFAGLMGLEIDTHVFKERIFERARAALQARRATGAVAGDQQGGEAALTAAIDRWRLPADTPPEYLRQLVSEHYAPDPRTRKMAWILRPGMTQNHYLDATVYADAVAYRCLLHELAGE